MNRLKTQLAKIKMKNPVTVASGTFGIEFAELFDLTCLGVVVTKTITLEPKAGNHPPRLYETPSGLLNSIGLQNPGVEIFIKESLPDYRKILEDNPDNPTPLVVSFSGATIREFINVLQRLEEVSGIAGYEVNVSCPNVEKEGLSFGVDSEAVYRLTKELKENLKTDRELIIKLTPNVTDIVEIAQAAEEGGCDSLALINTLIGMAIDWQTGNPFIKRGFGGLSGPAIKPVAVYNVFKVSQNTQLPILAMGGIATWQDALEFFYAGANAVAIGTGNFINPLSTLEIIDRLAEFLESKQLDLQSIIGKTGKLLNQ
ncbi:MAG: dihydroorotate dehydrogenase [Candidatus Cloacimonetes bacterium]|nr:dihydroorotate dehydrogenase [Candidatus Cloacimonadota bacterium]